MQNLQPFVPFLHELADAAAAETLPRFRAGLQVINKATGGKDDGIGDGLNPVTEADSKAEAAMRRLIESHYPSHGIVGEEYGASNVGGDWVWILDPIDGTRGFICGIPLWGTLIGLRYQGEPVLGMIAQPLLAERFYGSAAGSFYASRAGTVPLACRQCRSIDEAMISTTDPRLFSADERRRYEKVEKRAKLARYGYDCYAHAMVAMGNIDCVVEAGVSPHDIEPIMPVIAGAGGCVSDWAGNAAGKSHRIVTSGDRRLHEQILQELAD